MLRVVQVTLIFTVIFFQSSFAGETKFLLINGGANEKFNYRTYYNEIRYSYEILKSKGKDVSIATSDGTWNRMSQRTRESFSNFALTPEGKENVYVDVTRSYPPIDSDAKNLASIKKTIDDMRLKKGDTLVISLNGHGTYNPSVKPEDQYYELWGKRVKWSELKDILKPISSKTSIKLVTNVCYGGGIHSIAHSLPGVCSSSVGVSFLPTSSGSADISFFTKEFMDQFKGEKTHSRSLASASLEAFANDEANQGTGNLSSLDYVDKILGEGQYNEMNIVNPLKMFTDTDSGESVVQINSDASYNQTLAYNQEISVECDYKFIQRLNMHSGLNDIKETYKGLKKILMNKYIKHFSYTMSDFEKNKDELIKKISWYNNQVRELEAERKELLREQKSPGFLDYFTRDFAKEIMQNKEKYDDIQQKYRKNLPVTRRHLQRLRTLEKISRFLDVATPEQIDKFEDLWRCEWQSLNV